MIPLLAFLVLGSLPGGQAQLDPLSCAAKVGPLLEKAGGKLTPEVRKAYLDWAEATVRRNLLQKGQSVPQDCLAEVNQDPTLRDAIYGGVFPPDPSVLQNYSHLRTQLGTALTAKYRGMAIAFAVARRIKGVETGNAPDALNNFQDFGRENQGFAWDEEALHVPRTEPEVQLVHRIADFMRAEKCSAIDLYNNTNLQQKLILTLKAANVGPNFINETKQGVTFGERIKNAMVLLGQRPAARDPRPAPGAWLKYLVSVCESTPKSLPSGIGWPLFPIQTAPWPLLMPLAHSVPANESKYMYQAFEGDLGDDRFHTYGPYRWPPEAMPDMLRPSPYFWNAFPDHIIHGGVCVQISKATVDLYSALCKPAVWAGQPGHANLISFNYEGAWKADIEQDFAGGPPVTYAQWYFADEPRAELRFRSQFNWPAAEYHLGLAAGMNLGLTSYMDTRIASSIYQSLPPKDQKTVGMKLLTNALQINPFNPDIWYRIALNTSGVSRTLALVQAVKAHDPAGFTGEPTNPVLTKFVKSPQSGPANGTMDAFWRNVEMSVTQTSILAHSIPTSEDEMRKMYAFLKGVNGVTPTDLADYADRFVNTRPAEGQTAELQYDQDLAAKGDPYGCLRMGQRYLEGTGVPADGVKANQFLQLAARLGDPIAAVTLERLTPRLSTDGMEVVASSQYSDTQAAKHLIDGAGMVGGVHDNSIPADTMWQTVDKPALTPPAEGINASPAWVRFKFRDPIRFDAVEIWNHNQVNLTDRGFRMMKIYGSYDAKTWFPLTKTIELPRASGAPNEPGVKVPTNATVHPVKYVILAAEAKDGNYGSADYGLSAVRFVVRPIGVTVPASQIRVTASSMFSTDQDPLHLINGAGMMAGRHDNHSGAATMWCTPEKPFCSSPGEGFPESPAWVRFDFAQPRKFEAMLIWNDNQANMTDRGFRKTRIYGTSDGSTWFPLTKPEVIQIPQASGQPNAEATTLVNAAADRPITSVIIAAEPNEGNYGSAIYGLSAVRFLLRY